MGERAKSQQKKKSAPGVEKSMRSPEQATEETVEETGFLFFFFGFFFALTFRFPMSSINCRMSARPVLKQGFFPALEAASWQAAPSPAAAAAAVMLLPSLVEISAWRGSAASEDMANFVVVCCCCCCCCCGCEDLALFSLR